MKIIHIFSAAWLVFILTACSGQVPQSDDGNTGTVTLHVGESVTCYTAGSCTVYLVMPDGDGQYTVKQDGPNGRWTAGTFSANGQTVLLGQFYQGRTGFTIEGMDIPETWVTVISVF